MDIVLQFIGEVVLRLGLFVEGDHIAGSSICDGLEILMSDTVDVSHPRRTPTI